jgi:hypothetical protein
MKWEWLRWGLIIGGIAFVLVIVVVNLLNLTQARNASQAASRELVYVVPQGTQTRLGQGAGGSILPDTMELTLGKQDTLVIRNEDLYPIEVGGVLLHPGQAYRQTYTRAGTFDLVCSVHSGSKIQVIVHPQK